MNVDEVRAAYSDEVFNALFRAEGPKGSRGKHTLVYPYKDGRRGYLWVEWTEIDLTQDACLAIVGGGKERTFRSAVDRAVECLMDHLDR